MNRNFALHETLDVHELMAFKTVCRTKSLTMLALVSDERLAQLLQETAAVDKRHLQDLRALLNGSTVETDFDKGVVM